MDPFFKMLVKRSRRKVHKADNSGSAKLTKPSSEGPSLVKNGGTSITKSEGPTLTTNDSSVSLTADKPKKTRKKKIHIPDGEISAGFNMLNDPDPPAPASTTAPPPVKHGVATHTSAVPAGGLPPPRAKTPPSKAKTPPSTPRAKTPPPKVKTPPSTPKAQAVPSSFNPPEEKEPSKYIAVVSSELKSLNPDVFKPEGMGKKLSSKFYTYWHKQGSKGFPVKKPNGLKGVAIDNQTVKYGEPIRGNDGSIYFALPGKSPNKEGPKSLTPKK